MSIRGLSQALVAALVAALFSIMPFATPQALAAPNPNALNYNNNVCDLSTAGYDGDGSSGDPYKISDSDSLWEIVDCDFTNSARAYFELTRNIDVRQAVTANTSSPIGLTSSNAVTSFSGTLDGQNWSITNISISSQTRGVGLFEVLDGATISNLTIYGQITSGKTSETDLTDGTGGLAKRATGGVLITSVSNFVAVSGKLNTGGLIGYVSGAVQVDSSFNHADVSGPLDSTTSEFGTGGLVGWGNGAVVVMSSGNDGDVTARRLSGGLVGLAFGAVNIEGSANHGSVLATGGIAGGLLARGMAGATILNSSNQNQIVSNQYVGGFVGVLDGQLTIIGSENTGDVSVSATLQEPRAGGFAGYLTGGATLNNSTNSGDVRARGGSLGGAVGNIQPPSLSTVSLDGFVNLGRITSAADEVGGMIGFVRSANLIVSNSANTETAEISGNYYVGGIVGRHGGTGIVVMTNTVNSGAIVASTNEAGGLLGRSGVSVLLDVAFNSGIVSAKHNFSGGFIGRALEDVSISRSGNIGEIDAGSLGAGRYVGGFIGEAHEPVSIETSFNNSEVTGEDFVGGLLGWASKSMSIDSSYVSGTVSGTTAVDSLVGSHSQTVTTASTFVSIASAHAATTLIADMRQASTFTGFDFDTVWGFGTCNDNNGLPMLRVFGELVSYSSTSCTVVTQNNQQNNQQQIAEPVAPVAPKIPIFDAVFTASPGSEVLVTGREFDLFVSIAAEGNVLTISAQTATSVVLSIPELSPGIYDLVALTKNAGVTYIGQLRIIESQIQAEELREVLLTGLNPRSSWLNRGALDQLASISPAASSVTCLAYQDRQGVAARQKALSRAEHACRSFKALGLETKLVVYSKAPALASRLKLLFSN